MQGRPSTPVDTGKPPRRLSSTIGRFTFSRSQTSFGSSPQTRRHISKSTSSSSLVTHRDLTCVSRFHQQNGKLLVGGKNHLGIYDVVGELEMSMDILANTTATKRMNKKGQISDVSTGYHMNKNLVAASCANVVTIYDVNKPLNPLVTSFSEHTRSVNSIDFCAMSPNLLVCGGQDGTIKVWDIRTFKSEISISAGADSVRCLKWSPHADAASGKFGSVHDSGLLLKYDIRNFSQPERKINAHSGPALSLSWHPELDYVMTGGRDAKCCLWGMNSADNAAEMIIQTSESVNYVEFAPGCPATSIYDATFAKTGFKQETVAVYSLSRKYIPKYVVSTGAPTTSFTWWDSHTLFSTDKNTVLASWDLYKEPTVLSNMRKSVVAWRDVDGDGLTFVDQEAGGYGHTIKSPQQPHTRGPNIPLQRSNTVQHLSPVQHISGERPSVSSGVYFSDIRRSHGFSSFSSVTSSQQGIFLGVPYTAVAAKQPAIVPLDLPHIVQQLKASKGAKVSERSPVEEFKLLARELKFHFGENQAQLPVQEIPTEEPQSMTWTSYTKLPNSEDSCSVTSESDDKKRIRDLLAICEHNAELYLSLDNMTNFKTWIVIRDALVWEIEHGGEISVDHPDDEVVHRRTDSTASEYSDFTDYGSMESTYMGDKSPVRRGSSHSASAGLSLTFNKQHRQEEVPQVSQLKKQLDDEIPFHEMFENDKTPPWHPAKILRKVYAHSVESGDILMTISLILLFQESHHITTLSLARNTLHQFINMLHRYELFHIAADLIKYCNFDDISEMSSGTMIRLYCENCRTLIVNEASKEKFIKEYKPGSNAKHKTHPEFGFWYCEKCRKPNSTCIYCEKPIRKLCMGVLQCGHRGHFDCFRNWFVYQEMNVCPAGCMESEL